MSAIDILRRVTRPMTNAESEAMIRARYGVSRENESLDDPVSIKRARELIAHPNTSVVQTPLQRRRTTARGTAVVMNPKSQKFKLIG